MKKFFSNCHKNSCHQLVVHICNFWFSSSFAISPENPKLRTHLPSTRVSTSPCAALRTVYVFSFKIPSGGEGAESLLEKSKAGEAGESIGSKPATACS